MASQEGFKEIMPGPKPANQQLRSPPFGRPFNGAGTRHEQEHIEGQLLMLSTGLYRVKGTEAMSFTLHMGLDAEITSTGATQVVLSIKETDPALSDGFTIPAKVKVLLGKQGFNNTNQVVTANAAATVASGGAVTINTVENVNTAAFVAGDEATVMFVPAGTEDPIDKNLLLNERTFAALESPDRRTVIYDMYWGISVHPKFIDRDGDITNVGLGNTSVEMTSDNGLSSEHIGSATTIADGTRNDASAASDNGSSVGGARFGAGGYGLNMTRYDGMFSPLIRVSQPRGIVRFCTDRSKDSNTLKTSESSRGGFISAANTSELNPNPAYKLITGSSRGDASLPYFQLFHPVDEPLFDPRILIIGTKYLLQEVSDDEVQEMIRRSGRFKYKIVQDPNQTSVQSDGVTGPANWSTVVAAHRGQRMSFEDYKRATESVTDQTLNMLYGNTPSQQMGRTADPRSKHRRI
jgi:hypothetical protein